MDGWMVGCACIGHRSWRSNGQKQPFWWKILRIRVMMQLAIIGSERSWAHSCDVSSINAWGQQQQQQQQNDLEPLTKFNPQAHEAEEERRTWFKIHDGISELYVVPLSWTREFGSVDLDQGFALDVWMHAYSSMPACLLKNSDTGATGSTTGLQSCYCVVLFNAASLNLGKTKL